jgi:glycerol-3-phosphate dehydrogenase (NAD(P)+)
MKVAIIGAGSFGTAISWILGEKHDVVLWARNQGVVDAINQEHRNPRYLSETLLPAGLRASSDLAYTLQDVDAVVFASPSAALREVVERCAPYIDDSTPLIVATKGVEAHTGFTMIGILEEILGHRERLAAFSGPTHAEELVKAYPAAGVVAAYDEKVAASFQQLFSTPVFRIYTSSDVVGVELCGASKNVMAIIVGLSYGLGYGDNTAALIMTRGLAEISRLVCACGGEPLTCMGLAGMGDLVVTCTSRHSRNRRFGESLADGGTLEEFYVQTHMVVEGAVACASIRELAAHHGVELPLTDILQRIIADHADPRALVGEILARPGTYEFYGLGRESA